MNSYQSISETFTITKRFPPEPVSCRETMLIYWIVLMLPILVHLFTTSSSVILLIMNFHQLVQIAIESVGQKAVQITVWILRLLNCKRNLKRFGGIVTYLFVERSNLSCCLFQPELEVLSLIFYFTQCALYSFSTNFKKSCCG